MVVDDGYLGYTSRVHIYLALCGMGGEGVKKKTSQNARLHILHTAVCVNRTINRFVKSLKSRYSLCKIFELTVRIS